MFMNHVHKAWSLLFGDGPRVSYNELLHATLCMSELPKHGDDMSQGYETRGSDITPEEHDKARTKQASRTHLGFECL